MREAFFNRVFWGLTGLAALGWMYGCAGSLQRASAGQVGCKPDDIEISDESGAFSIGPRTWTATCRNRAYSCSSVAGDESAQISCSPMGGDDTWAAGPATGGTAATPTGSDGNPGASKVERVFDSKRGVQLVRGIFPLSLGLKLNLLGVPQLVPGRVAVVLTGKSRVEAIQICDQMRVLVNAQPVETDEVTFRSRHQRINLEGRFDFTAFKPLSQRYPAFGVEACGQQWKLPEREIAELQKFLVIFEQIAQQVEAGELEDKSGGGPAPEPEPSAPQSAAADPAES